MPEKNTLETSLPALAGEKTEVNASSEGQPLVEQQATFETIPINADDLAKPLAEGMPEPTSAKIQESQPPLPPAKEIKDDFGTVFNPEKHRADSFGNPVKKNGRFLSTRGRKEGVKNGATQANAEIQSDEPKKDFVNTSGIPDQFDTAAEMLLQTGYGVASMFLSDGIRPENEGEHLTLRAPLAAVLREKGVVELTPTQLLAFTLAAYIGKKAGNPTVKERALLCYIKIKSFFSKNKNVEIAP